MVQTTKTAARRMSARDSPTHRTWDEKLPFFMLAINATPQSYTGLAPMVVMFGQTPHLPSSIRERMSGEVDFDVYGRDEVLLASELLARADMIQHAGLVAADNLAIAQHKDRLRYAVTHGGQYVPTAFLFKPGDYVYLLREAHDLFHLPTRQQILRIVELRDNGVVVLEGRDMRQCTRHIQNLVPCHLKNVDPYQNDDEVDETISCVVCHRTDYEARMLMCDECETFYHLFCLVPPLATVPEGDWFCPDCTPSHA